MAMARTQAKIQVRVSTNFDRNLDALKAFLIEADAANAWNALLDVLFDTLIPNLQSHPRLGRDFLARAPRSVEGQMIHARVSLLLGADGELREYIHGNYLVLYALTGHMVTLLAIKHHRQLSFDLPKFWS